MKTLIKDATLLDMVGDKPNVRKTDILINDNIIEKIEENIQDSADEIIDAISDAENKMAIKIEIK